MKLAQQNHIPIPAPAKLHELRADIVVMHPNYSRPLAGVTGSPARYACKGWVRAFAENGLDALSQDEAR